MGDFTLRSAHNFGIYTKSGKRTIFQIDFGDKKVSLIERGKIAKCFEFSSIDQYDSEDDLHIVIRIRGNKTLEFDADTAEEKYTICRLLAMILNPDSSDTPGDVETRENGWDRRLSTPKQVIKEGLIDKKGNTKIPTWSRRRLQVCPGEFSYYKPGDEVALNLVQLWENSTNITKSGQNGFVVAVRDRSYFFRVCSEKGVNIELERDRWLNAFEQAKQRKRATFLLLEMSNQQQAYSSRQGVPLPLPPTEEEDEFSPAHNHSSGSSGSASSREIIEGLQIINELDQVLNDETTPGPMRDIALSVVQKTSPMLPAPTKHRARPPAYTTNQNKTDDATYEFIPEPDYSPPASPTSPTPPSGRVQETGSGPAIVRDQQGSGVYTKRITPNSTDQGANRDLHSSGAYAHVIRGDSSKRNDVSLSDRVSGEYTKQIKPGPGAVNVMSNFKEIPKLKRVEKKDKPFDKSFDNDQNSPRVPDSPRKANEECDYDDCIVIKPSDIKDKSPQNMPIYDNQSEPPGRPTSPKAKTKPAPAAPSGLRPAPPPPLPVPGGPPAPPPLFNPHEKASRGKLKQVHWNRTPKPMVATSIWAGAHDVTPRLDLRLLEEQFAVKERDVPSSPGLKSPTSSKPQLLVDGKRAQILDIFISGLKNEGTGKLVRVLNSVTEDETFPAEKLTTIRRYQPTEDEIDMYKAHAHRKHELHPVDQFMLELCEIPCLSVRIDICMTLWEFPWQFDSTCQLVEQVHDACDELLTSSMLVRVLEYILAIGNHLNRNWSENNVATGFQLTSLDKVLSVRGKDSGYTLVHYLVQQLRQAEPALLQWPDTVQTVKKCEQVSVKSVAAESEVLKCDLSKVKKHLKTLKSHAGYQNRQDNKFQQEAQNVTVEYEMKLEKLDRRCGELHNKYRKILARFGEPMYQRSDQMFAVIGTFVDTFRAASKDLDNKLLERKQSS